MIGIREQNRGVKFKVSTLTRDAINDLALLDVDYQKLRRRSYVILVVNSLTHSFVTVSNRTLF